MPLRFPLPRRAWQPAVAAFAIAMSFLAAPTHGQEASPPPFGLKDSDGGAPPAPDGGLPAVSDNGLPPPADAATDASQPNAQQKPNAQKDKQPKKQVKRKPPPPPDLQPYLKAQRAGLPGGPPAFNPAKTPPPTVAALPPIPVKHRPTADEKPFDPVGVRLGDMKLLPTIEEDIGYASNPSLLAGSVLRVRSIRTRRRGLPSSRTGRATN